MGGSVQGSAITFSLTASTTCCAAPSVASFRRFRASSAALDAWSTAFWPPSCCAGHFYEVRCIGSVAYYASLGKTSASQLLRDPDVADCIRELMCH